MNLFGRPAPTPVASVPAPRRLIVVEAGARSAAAAIHPDGGDATDVVVAWSDEKAAAFERRLRLRLAAFERSHQAVGQAVLVVASDTEPGAPTARAALARALLSSMAAHGSGELVVAAIDVNASTREALLCLVENLLEEFHGAHVSIRLQLRKEAAHKDEASGVHRIPGAASGSARHALG